MGHKLELIKLNIVGWEGNGERKISKDPIERHLFNAMQAKKIEIILLVLIQFLLLANFVKLLGIMN